MTQHELVWDDQVSPELTIDFDAQHISSTEGLLWWLAGLGFFASILGGCYLYDPASRNPAVNRMANMIPDKVVMEDAATVDEGEDEEDDEDE